MKPKRHTNGSPGKAYSDGFAAGYAKGREELREQADNLKAHLARIEAENAALRSGQQLPALMRDT
jgi:flagellar biosynthesis/type III secretory pathway protein FliH